ncbi:MAG: rnhB [Sedimentibacter sp.]|nr:rnhB [Sedimentibacter sp.]
MLKIEKEIWDKGYNYIACIDEVGRGCLAGSVVACAVIMPKDLLIEGVNDSKKLTAKKRDKMFDLIMDAAVAIGIGEMDCEKLDIPLPQSNIIHGDAKCHGIAAASIIAKVTRDRQMEELDKEYPLYSFSKNKGYGTKDHVKALLKFGPIKIHRRTFLKKILNTDEQMNFL